MQRQRIDSGRASLSGYWRETALVLLLVALLVAVMKSAPLAQPQYYHVFVDQRSLLGVPNFLNVLSSIPFLLVGALGSARCMGRRAPAASTCWAAFFIGAAFVGLGSAYYHWAPTDGTLLWDRLPMTVGFMGLFVALLAEHLGERVARYLLVPALALGVASVLWWRWSDDLRLYVWVQLASLVSVPCVLALFPARYTHRWFLLVALPLYVLAKVMEYVDAAVYEMTGHAVSGHTLKHLLAASAIFVILLMLRRRTAVTRSS